MVILLSDKGPVTVDKDKTDYCDKMDALVNNKSTKNLNATSRQHFNVNLTAKYLRLKRLTLLTLMRCGGLMVSALVSGSSGPGSSPGRGHCVVFLGKTLYSHSASLHPGV